MLPPIPSRETIVGANWWLVFPLVSNLPPVLPPHILSHEKAAVGDGCCFVMGSCSGMPPSLSG